ncbi:MAG: bifunctional diaminohydroxyphosphoribosylaminopyrimidine deaminase/5-amino-6-(5-phosphoribosylamino)uracil reductase RibD [Acidobacteria bacterium]|nr:bifunctional diaminohydroxyphosphoribosylaminopyrimidine deaminase/5-amino-6-(5-phosphoribosylamino)uracil reductase RibD [Acidobacteriota bacterium]
MTSHERYMKRALALARRGAGLTSPNPLVGAVLVKDSQVVGEGFHVYADYRHAEVVALEKAGEKATGSTLYVNLEPCFHFGRTPPCVDRIISSGLKSVYVAVSDPNPLVAGKGIEKLRTAGIQVHEGVCKEEAMRLNEGFLHYMTTGKPFVTLKLALTLDGKIATRTGESRWITGESARKKVHRLRFESDAIITGVNTLIVDDPSLNVRWRKKKAITRVVLDSSLRTPEKARLFQSPEPVIIFHSSQAPQERMQVLSKSSQLVAVPTDDAGGLCWDAILAHLATMRLIHVLIEGGARTAASALKAGVVQKISFFYAPRILGGDAASGIAALEIDLLQQAVPVAGLQVHRIGSDFLVEGYPEAK